MSMFKRLFRKLFAEEISSFQRQIQSQQQTKELLTLQIIELKEAVTSYSNQCNTLQETISNKDTEIESNNQRLTILERTLSEKKIECDNYRIRIEQLVENKEELIEEKNAQNQQLLDKIEILRKQIANLISQNSALEIREQALSRELSEAKSVTAEKERENKELSAILHSKENDLLVLKQSGEMLEEEMSRLNALLSDSKSQIVVLSSRNEILESEQQALSAQLNEIQSHRINEELLTTLKNEVKLGHKAISDLESEIQSLNEELSYVREEKSMAETYLRDQKQECEDLKKELQSIYIQLDGVNDNEKKLEEANRRITQLEDVLENAPNQTDLDTRDQEISRLKSIIREYEIKINNIGNDIRSDKADTIDFKSDQSLADDRRIIDADLNNHEEVSNPRIRKVYKKPKFPYRRRPLAPSENVVTVDFPLIENENVYSQTARLIDRVFNHRSNSYISANDVFLNKSVEEISRIRFELEEAVRTGVPYLSCPCCGNMVKISCRIVGFGVKSREVQYFTHAVKNVPCDLKRDNSYYLYIEGENAENDGSEYPYLKELRTLLANSLKTSVSRAKGISDVRECVYIVSDELPIMKRRFADVTARYNDIDLVLELVTPTTHIARVHDRDIFYLINRKQVFWIFGIESIVDYSELRRSVSKDILFTNKRNVFVYDIEAQEESRRRGEMILKCNWLDENGEWYFQREKNGINGFLISLDQIHFEPDSCRPYFYDADEAYYLKHPTAERPLKLSREKLKNDVIESWNYDNERKQAIAQMRREDRCVEAYSDGIKWGFKFKNTVFIELIFDSKPIMQGYLAKVEKDGKFGVVNRYGDYLLQVEYDRVELLPNGYILYAAKYKWYLFDVIDPIAAYTPKDKIVIKTISKISSIYYIEIKLGNQRPDEFYFVGSEIFKKNSNSGKWSLWQSSGEKVTDVTWDSFEFTPENRIKVISNGNTQILSLDGRVIKEYRYKSETRLKNGYVVFGTFDGHWGIADREYSEVVEPKYDAIIPISDDYVSYKKGKLWGIMTSNGMIITDPIYRSIERFDGSHFDVTLPDDVKGWGYLSGKVDQAGQKVSETISQTDNCIISISFEKYGLEKDGVIHIPHIYDFLSYWGCDKYIAKKGRKLGIIDIRNNVLLPFEYSIITPLQAGKSTIKKGMAQYEIDSNLSILEETIIKLHEGYTKVKKGGKWGIHNPQGEVIVEYRYDEISTFRGRLIGIINGRLVRLNAYYPYRLPMEGEFAGYSNPYGKKKPRKLIKVGGVMFQLYTMNTVDIQAPSCKVFLVNWHSKCAYPDVMMWDGANINKKAKHIDKSEDFITGETYSARIVSVIQGKNKSNTSMKGFDVQIGNDHVSHIYGRDIRLSGLQTSELSVGDIVMLTKMGYDDDLDRTIWRIRKSIY